MSRPDISVDEAFGVIRADYYREVREMALDLAQRMKSGDVADEEALSDALHDDVDGCQRVIYTFRAKLGLLANDNEDAAEDEGVEATTPESRMYYALQADIREELDARGVDMSDPDSWPEIDLGEFS